MQSVTVWCTLLTPRLTRNVNFYLLKSAPESEWQEKEHFDCGNQEAFFVAAAGSRLSWIFIDLPLFCQSNPRSSHVKLLAVISLSVSGQSLPAYCLIPASRIHPTTTLSWTLGWRLLANGDRGVGVIHKEASTGSSDCWCNLEKNCFNIKIIWFNCILRVPGIVVLLRLATLEQQNILDQIFSNSLDFKT